MKYNESQSESKPKSRLSLLVDALVDKRPTITDPFDENYFDRQEYEAKRLAEEPAVIAEALAKAAIKGVALESERQVVKHREIKERYWE